MTRPTCLLTTTLLVFASLVGVLGAASCAKRTSEARIGVGVVLPLTGSLSTYGKWALNGLQLAADQQNASTGAAKQRVELLVEDSMSSPKDAVSAFTKLVAVWHVPVIIGFIGSSEALACAPVANRTRTVLFSSAAASPDLTGAGAFVFRNRVSGTLEVSELARYAKGHLGLQRIGIVYINNDYGKSYEVLFEREFKRLGGRVIFAEGFDQGATDFRPIISKLARLSGLQAVYLPVHTKEGATLLRQARELALSIQFLASNAIVSPDLFTIAGAAADGLIYSEQAYDPTASVEVTRAFDEKYVARFGQHSEMFAANAYDALNIVLLAIQKGGYTGDGIRAAIHQIADFPGVSGKTTFDKNGDVIKPVALRQIKGQQSVTLPD